MFEFEDDAVVYLTVEGMDDNSLLQQDVDRLAVWESGRDMEVPGCKGDDP